MEATYWDGSQLPEPVDFHMANPWRRIPFGLR